MSRLESPDMQLVELLRRSDGPSDEDMRRVRSAIGVRLAVGAAASTAILGATRTSWAARLGTMGAWGKGLAVVTGLVGAGVGISWYATPEAILLGSARGSRPETLQPVVTHEAVPASTSSVDPTLPKGESANRTESVPGPVSPDPKVRTTALKSSARAASSTLEAELVLLGRAQNALKGGQPNEALGALEDHARRFPNGVLAVERSGVRTVALCQAGRLAEGRAAAKSYLRLVPNSVLSKRIRIACQLADE